MVLLENYELVIIAVLDIRKLGVQHVEHDRC